MADMVFGDDLSKREKWFKFFAENPLFWESREFQELDKQREIAYKRI